jgi:hypothetical protein
MDIYKNIPSSQIEAQKRYLYGAIIQCLYLDEAQDPYLDAHIQGLINQISGLNRLFRYQPEVLTILGHLETARKKSDQFRKAILDAANLVNSLNGGDNNA